jgi:hypothetical protein
MNNDTIRARYTPRQYHKHLVNQGYEAVEASQIVNAIFN